MESLFIGQNLIELNSVDSTNSYALELMKNSLPVEGSLIYAHTQTGGRGQRGKQWQSEPNSNLTFSIVLYPNLTVAEQVYLTKVVSLGITDYLDSIKEFESRHPQGVSQTKSLKARIKWPNDIYVGDKKIAGILIENNLKGEQVVSSVAGIGFNVNQMKFDGLDSAVSLRMLTGFDFGLSECLSGLCGRIEARYLQLKTNKKDLLDLDFLKKAYNLPVAGGQE